MHFLNKYTQRKMTFVSIFLLDLLLDSLTERERERERERVTRQMYMIHWTNITKIHWIDFQGYIPYPFNRGLLLNVTVWDGAVWLWNLDHWMETRILPMGSPTIVWTVGCIATNKFGAGGLMILQDGISKILNAIASEIFRINITNCNWDQMILGVPYVEILLKV